MLIKEGLDIFQVTKSLENIDTKKREIDGLLNACKTYKLNTGLILIQYGLEQDGIKFQVMCVEMVFIGIINSDQ